MKRKIEPFVDHLIWRLADWHYTLYMSRSAKDSLLSKQKECADSLSLMIKKLNASRCTKSTLGNKYLRVALPIVSPFHRQSNPFCRISQNRTGWKFLHRQRVPEPRPHGHHKIGGTDPSVPVLP